MRLVLLNAAEEAGFECRDRSILSRWKERDERPFFHPCSRPPEFAFLT